jgi:hypothetical protein
LDFALKVLFLPVLEDWCGEIYRTTALNQLRHHIACQYVGVEGFELVGLRCGYRGALLEAVAESNLQCGDKIVHKLLVIMPGRDHHKLKQID